MLFSSKADSVLSLTAMRKPKYCGERELEAIVAEHLCVGNCDLSALEI